MADFNENTDVDSIIERLLDGMLLTFDPTTPSARFSLSLALENNNNRLPLPTIPFNGGEPFLADLFNCYHAICNALRSHKTSYAFLFL
jgi:hypothetical protein